jgi:hypothetical protein
MFAVKFADRGLRLASMLALLIVASSCGKDTTEEEPEPNVVSVRLTIGSVTKTLSGAASEDNTFTIARGANAVTAVWLTTGGGVDPVATTAKFTLKIVPGNSAITYTPSATQSFTGTLNVASAVTNATAQYSLFHVAEGHEDFGPFTIKITAP